MPASPGRTRRPRVALLLTATAAASTLAGCAPRATTPSSRMITPVAATAVPERAVRRTLPMTNTIRRAHAMETRDSTGRPGRDYWQLRTEYTIDARLDPATSTVTGRESVVIQNASDSSLRMIVLRLDQNVYRDNVARLERVPEITGGMKVSRLAVNGQAVLLLDDAGRTRPQSGTPMATGLETTVARIMLPTPIPAKGQATLEAEWSFRVPAVEGGRGMRMGRLADTLYQVAQWYPRVAVYDDLRGWNDEPYLGPSEFYNNFGRFDVRLEVPAGWLVGATGVLQNADAVLTPAVRERLARVTSDSTIRTIVAAGERGTVATSGATQRWQFVADTVGDFAWATARSYMWEATSADIPGRGRVPVNVLRQPGSTAAFTNAARLARHALEFYSRLWMPYAFPQLTLADGPELGMEYPMFIMSAAGAADHEAGHEWWPMMVGVNETWYGWMDEGFNMYMNILSDADYLRRPAILDGVGQSYGQMSGDEREGALMWNANYGGPAYGFQAYGKAPEMLSMLGGIVGDSAVQRAMSEYAKAWRFKHPSPWDYAFFMSRALGQDLDWFWYYWLFTTESVQGSIASVDTAGGRARVTVRQDGEMPAPVVLRVEFAASGPAIRPMPGARMEGERTAIVTFPVDVWFTGSRTFTAELDFGGRAIERVTLDPFRRFPDRDPKDNVWPRAGMR
jgi:hypothetical protein